MTFEEWRDQHLKRGAEDFSKRGTPSHLYGCNRECLREAWEAARADLGITTSADSDAKVTPADGSITLGSDPDSNFANGSEDATAETDEIPPQRVKASRLPDDFAKQFYEATRRGERPPVPVADDDVIIAASWSSWENLRRDDNRLYGVDILVLRLIARIKRFVIVRERR